MTHRRVATLAIACGMLALPAVVAPAAGQESEMGTVAQVAIGYADYLPAALDVLVGDRVEWKNESVRRHTVTDDGGAYDSGTLATGSGFAHVFTRPGSFPYHCTLHASIRGEVDAWTLLLDPVHAAAQPGQAFPLTGRAALPPASEVSIEADDGAGGRFRRVATTRVGPDGRFAASVTPSEPAAYRAVAGAAASPPVQLLVLNHEITARVARRGRRTAVSVHVSPPDPGGVAVLQLHLRERFGWWPIARRRLDRSSRARFVVRRRRAASARVLLTLRDGATPLAASQVVRVGARR